MGVTVKNLSEFRKALSAANDRITKGSLAFQQELAASALSKIVRYTPVDTGRARGNWNLSFNGPDLTADPDKFDKSGSTTIAIGLTKLVDLPPWSVRQIYISNGIHYVKCLEDGSSKQAPFGMVARTFAELKVRAKDLLRARIQGLNQSRYIPLG